MLWKLLWGILSFLHIEAILLWGFFGSIGLPRLEKIKAYEARDDYSDLIAETLDSVETYLFDKNGRVVTQDMKEQEVKKEEKDDFSGLL